jgi:hypothetical protein
MTPFESTVAHISPQPTLVYGLKFFPSLEPHCSNDQDSPNWGWHEPEQEVTDCNLSVVTDVMQKMGVSNINSIMEIGVSRPNKNTITKILLGLKSQSCVYLGVDMEDKSFLDSEADHIHTIRSTSHDKVRVRGKLRNLGIKNIDLLIIDGWHSVNTCVNDWAYTDLLSDHGAVLLHDTNAHPGCIALYHAIDEEIFIKERFCTDHKDHGIAVFWHKK